jgi:hypothetical protein
MDPENLPTNPTALRLKTWFLKTITADYFRRVAMGMTICLVIYLVYLLVKHGPVNLGVLLVFVLTSFGSQVFYTQDKSKPRS